MTFAVSLGTVFLVCQDLARSAQFYRDLGFHELEAGRRSYRFWLNEQGRVELHLHQELTPEEQRDYRVSWQPGSTGQVLSFQVENLKELAARIPPDQILVAERSTPWGTRMLMVEDPDGYRLEFQEAAHG